MAVVIRNESGGNWYFGSGSASKLVAPNQVEQISDDEWATVATSKRGPGGIHCLWPTLTDSVELKTELDYYTTASTNQVRYLGYAPQDALDNAAVWSIKRFDYVDLGGGDVRVSQIQSLVNVAWSDRATLPWS